MDYKISNIEGNTLTLLDTINLDEWGKPSTLTFIMDDTDCFYIGQPVKIMIIGRKQNG